MTTSALRPWNVDPSHSSILFSIRHLVIARVRGKFSKFSGVLELDEADLTKSRVTIEIDVASLDTSQEQRDTHLKSADFFEVATFPTATFTSRSIKNNGEDYDVRGDFSLHGITQEITLQTTFGGRVKDAMGRERAVFEARTSLDRETFGLRWNRVLEAGGVAVGPTAELEISLQAIKA